MRIYVENRRTGTNFIRNKQPVIQQAQMGAGLIRARAAGFESPSGPIWFRRKSISSIKCLSAASFWRSRSSTWGRTVQSASVSR
jgi:hypothetical protein